MRDGEGEFSVRGEFFRTRSGRGAEAARANTCYTPTVPVTCFNLWRTAKRA